MSEKKIIQNNVYILLVILISTEILFVANNIVKPKLPLPDFNDDNYEQQWKEIDSLEHLAALPKSALKKVNQLYERAKQDNNHVQIIKTLIYKRKYEATLSEDGFAKAIEKLKRDADTLGFPLKPILQSMLAEQYIQYLETHRWQLRNRTQTTEKTSHDIRTWSVSDFIAESRELYLKSIAEDAIKQVALKDFQAIIHPGKHNENLRPTLYDFLTHRTLDFLTNERTYLNRPAYRFSIDQAEAFAPAAAFAKFTFRAQDSISFKYLALLQFQRLLAFHLNDSTPDALLNADLKRLNFVYRHSVVPDKKQLYLQALQNLAAQYQNRVAYAEISHSLAKIYWQTGKKYRASYLPEQDSLYKWDFKKALNLCQRAIERFPKSYGAVLCHNLKCEILGKNLYLEVACVTSAYKAILAKLTYKNLTKIYIKAVKTDTKKNKKQQRMNRAEKVDYLNRLNSLWQKEVSLPPNADYQEHSVELALNALPFGEYVLLVADNEDFSYQKNAVAFTSIKVSNLAYFTQYSNDSIGVYVLDRERGVPMKNVLVEFYTKSYKNRKYTEEKKGVARTNNRGYASCYSKNNKGLYNWFFIKLINKQDILFENTSHLLANQKSFEMQKEVHFFSDRVVYRPGQTVYFKIIATERDKGAIPTILAHESVRVSLRDANGQQLAQQQLITNEYGTASGHFILPANGLLGRMSLQNSLTHHKHYFSVEEYKRPNFEVGFNTIATSYRLNDEIILGGWGRTYSASPLDAALVKYRVARSGRFPYWNFDFDCPVVSETEIVSGETRTDASGRFEISFQALPDRSVALNQNPEFTYNIYADITDITGETRAIETNVRVGTIALLVDIPIPEKLNRDSTYQLLLETANLNGEYEAAKGAISIVLLKSPDVALHKRLWDTPDKFLLTESEFKQLFPHDPYRQENQCENWQVLKTIYEEKFDTEKNKEIILDPKRWKTGMYRLNMKTRDKYGTAIEVNKYFLLYDLKKKEIPAAVSYFHVNEKNNLQPGQIAHIYVGSAQQNVMILYHVADKSKASSQWIDVKKMVRKDIAIQEAHRGGLYYHISFIKHNRVHNHRYRLHVPWKNKQLSIEYTTFRDKLKPGQQEEWQLKVTGTKGEKVAAEMVATMYDASLHALQANQWKGIDFYANPAIFSLSSGNCHVQKTSLIYRDWLLKPLPANRQYTRLNWFDFARYTGFYRGNAKSYFDDADALMVVDEEVELDLDSVAPEILEITAQTPTHPRVKLKQQTDLGDINIRANLNETVFFFPHLYTDREGSLIIKFKMNETLTKWKFLGFAHTKDLKNVLTEKEIITQKDLMVQANPPRFLRQNDTIVFPARVNNLTGKTLQGTAALQLSNALNGQPVAAEFGLNKMQQSFSVKEKQSTLLQWTLKIPSNIAYPLTYRLLAKAGNFSDGEEGTLPIVSNRILITETLPLAIGGKQQKDFVFNALKNNSSNTLKQHRLTVAFTSNPAWYAVQALPYLMEHPHECTEQIFSRYYANSLAAQVVKTHPKLKQIFAQWKNTDALKSSLAKNQDLKNALLAETPWVLQSQSEALQKQQIALLFDLNKMSDEINLALQKIAERQRHDGGFPWFPGGQSNNYITRYIVAGLGYLQYLGVRLESRSEEMLQKALRYIDNALLKEYWHLEKQVEKKYIDLQADHLSYSVCHYLYVRSFFPEYNLPKGDYQKAYRYYISQAKHYWMNKNRYSQAMLCLALHRKKDGQTPAKIITSLKEYALHDDQLGMYWKNDYGYYWYELPIETQSLMIEVFSQVAQDKKAVEDLKIWLLKQKQTRHWKTTKATASAVYALLMYAEDWPLEENPVTIRVGQQTIDQSEQKTSVASGEFKVSWQADEIQVEMAKISVENPNTGIAWGALHWQYFENIDKIKSFNAAPLALKKQVFLQKNTDRGVVLSLVKENTFLKVGDLLKIRIELRVGRAMEYVHMKDMRAGGLEPINLLSGYKWQNGLGYYESTRDLATDFFFSQLPKGVYVFEYPLRVVHKGNFSNGITTIQSMYAPEFASHSKGVRVKIRHSP